MENEIESQEDVTARLQKIEKMLANEKVHTHDLEKTLQNTYKMVDILKSRLINLVNKIHYFLLLEILFIFCIYLLFLYEYVVCILY